jgi:hypothetical protein
MCVSLVVGLGAGLEPASGPLQAFRVVISENQVGGRVHRHEAPRRVGQGPGDVALFDPGVVDRPGAGRRARAHLDVHLDVHLAAREGHQGGEEERPHEVTASVIAAGQAANQGGRSVALEGIGVNRKLALGVP